MFTRPRLQLIIVVTVLIGTALPQARAQRPEKERLRTSGSLKAMAPGFLQIVTDSGDQWTLKLEAKPEDVTFEATAEPDWLRAGMMVRFSGNFNKKGEPQAPVSELTVFTPTKDTVFGAIPDSPLGAADLFKDPNAPPQAEPDFSPFLVVGKLTGLKNGQMTVQAGRARVRAQLAEKAAIQVEVADFRFAREGDKVEVEEGWYFAGAPGRAIVSRLKIVAAEPLEGAEKARRGRTRRDADEKEPAQEASKP